MESYSNAAIQDEGKGLGSKTHVGGLDDYPYISRIEARMDVSAWIKKNRIGQCGTLEETKKLPNDAAPYSQRKPNVKSQESSQSWWKF
jgi:hypothetical protein